MVLVLRRLHWPAEKSAWLDLVEASFAAKGTPRSYFQRHLDLSSDASDPLILVAVEDPEDPVEDSTLLSTLRIFRLRQRSGKNRLNTQQVWSTVAVCRWEGTCSGWNR